MAKPFVDRTCENDADPEIVVTLSCGFAVRFWLTGLSDAEYVRRTKQIKLLEERGDRSHG